MVALGTFGQTIFNDLQLGLPLGIPCLGHLDKITLVQDHAHGIFIQNIKQIGYLGMGEQIAQPVPFLYPGFFQGNGQWIVTSEKPDTDTDIT